jgi:hypothetical protein
MGCCYSIPIRECSEETLSFPIGSPGTFEFLGKLIFAQYLSQIKGKSSFGSDWGALTSTSSRLSLNLEINQSFQFHFPNLQFEITGYQFHSNLHAWVIQVSNNGRDWTTIH